MKKLMMMAMVAVAAMVATADDYSFTYQAELKDDKGAALGSRNQTVEIRLWKTATGTNTGDLLWGRTYNIYTDENGLFNQEISDSIGSRTSDSPNVKLSEVFCNNGAGAVYLGLKVKDSAGEITPRQRLFAVPFAGRANSANNLVGDSHTVEGKLNLTTTNATLSASGLVLPADSASTIGDLTAENLKVKRDVTFSGNLQYNGTLSGGDGKSIVPVPVGGVIMWTKADAPANGTWDPTGKSSDGYWAICNGNNDTPNLCGRFVVGVGSVTDGEGNAATYDLGAKDGVNTHKLTTDEMPSHTHVFGQDVNLDKVDGYAAGKSIGGKGFKSSDSDVHFHPFDTKSTGGGKAHENRPPYYALYYIMRVK